MSRATSRALATALMLTLGTTACAEPRGGPRAAPQAARRVRVVVLAEGPARAALVLRITRVAERAGRSLARFDVRTLLRPYIGETEKNLREAFAAGGPGVILLFDEADALFGKRTEVRDAHDRYANQEVSYLRAGGVVLVGVRSRPEDGAPQVELRPDASDEALRALLAP